MGRDLDLPVVGCLQLGLLWVPLLLRGLFVLIAAGGPRLPWLPVTLCSALTVCLPVLKTVSSSPACVFLPFSSFLFPSRSALCLTLARQNLRRQKARINTSTLVPDQLCCQLLSYYVAGLDLGSGDLESNLGTWHVAVVISACLISRESSDISFRGNFDQDQQPIVDNGMCHPLHLHWHCCSVLTCEPQRAS